MSLVKKSFFLSLYIHIQETLFLWHWEILLWCFNPTYISDLAHGKQNAVASYIGIPTHSLKKYYHLVKVLKLFEHVIKVNRISVMLQKYIFAASFPAKREEKELYGPQGCEESETSRKVSLNCSSYREKEAPHFVIHTLLQLSLQRYTEYSYL